VKILYATDGGEPARQALELIARIGSRERTDITVATVADKRIGTDEAGKLVASAVEALRAAGFRAEPLVLSGRPAPALMKEIADGGHQATVLGTGNRSIFSRLLLGSVSTKVLQASPSSVLLVQRISGAMGRARVMFATDGSDHAGVALGQMADLLDPSSCEVELVSVAEHLMAMIAFPIPREAYVASAPTPEVEREWLDAAERVASDAASTLERSGFQSTARAVLGAPTLRLLEEIDATVPDLVVAGSRGLGAIDKMVLGSVSDQVARNSPATFVARA
jgi:nucleotide-binding universal stress UspA family protein